MKKYLLIVLVLILALCVIFGGCDVSKLSPWGEKSTQNKGDHAATYSVYVYGAVKNEGFYQVQKGDTYYQAIMQAGLLKQSKLTANYYSIVTDTQLSIAVHYVENGTEYECVNVNGRAFEQGLDVPNVAAEVVAKIADYVQKHGKIHNQSQLRAALGDDYETNYYKMYVAEEDYEAIG